MAGSPLGKLLECTREALLRTILDFIGVRLASFISSTSGSNGPQVWLAASKNHSLMICVTNSLRVANTLLLHAADGCQLRYVLQICTTRLWIE